MQSVLGARRRGFLEEVAMSGEEGLREMGLLSWEKGPLRKKLPAMFS